ncbi:MAG: cupin domain-containing protein [Planctomycetales bacterium]|nr:cupin domain-containing protein [Planctomycetales bacterium]
MAVVHIQDENRQITDPDAIREFLEPFGIWYERWDVEGRLGAEATNDEILATYEPEINRLKQRGGFVTADVINVSPETPGLDAMLEKFNKEHTHSDDEVRFTVKGSGVFHIHPSNGPVFGVQVESGDLINVPAGVRHWFDLCSDRTIRCIRLFVDPSGWAPLYVDDPLHAGYQPLCFGPNYLPAAKGFDSVVKP